MFILVLGNLGTHAEAKTFFVFGDSLVDNGNNNYLFTTARADAPPYGIDYPSHRPTGRFSNGLNIPDVISNVSLLLDAKLHFCPLVFDEFLPGDMHEHITHIYV